MTAALSLRRITALAVPAVVVLAAEPLYILVDTAVIGHLGSEPLAALAIGGSSMSFLAMLGAVMSYGTTGRSARRFGAGDRAGAVEEGVQASYLALAAGLLIAIVVQFVAGPVTRLLAGDNHDVADAAAGWLRIAVLGAPGLMLSTAGNGWLRGVQDTRRPLYYILGANALSAVLCPVLVYPLGLGLQGSAIANVAAQTVAGVMFGYALFAERVSLRPHPAVMGRQLVLGRDLLLRGVAFQVLFLSAAAVVARFGVAALGAHQIALQLWFFSALVLDGVAIAAQSLVGAALGGSRADEAVWLARRVTVIGAVSGVIFALLTVASAGFLPSLFSTDDDVYAQAMRAWPWFVAMQLIGGVVFALDGVLIGAGDVGFMRNLTVGAVVSGFLPALWVAWRFDLGLGGVWAALNVFLLFRLAGVLLRLRSGQWAVLGATR